MKIRNEVKIGTIALVAFVLGYLGLNFLKGINIFEPENSYRVRLKDLNGTAIATPVMISGYKVGSVQKISFGYDPQRGYGADLVIGLDPEVKIPKGSTIRVKTNVLSGAELIIVAPQQPESSYLSSGDSITVAQGEDIMVTLTDKVLPSVMDILPELTATLQRLNAIANNPAIDSMLRNLNHSSAEMTRAMSKLNETMRPMPEVMGNMNTLSKSLVAVGQKAERLPLDSLVANLNSTTENLRHMSAQLKSQEGTAGKLLNDPSLYNKLDSLAGSAEALMKDLKENPKRYVHFSIFGRKQ